VKTYFIRTMDKETKRPLAAIPWDAVKDAPLAEFDRQGLFETDDPILINKLDKLGYGRISVSQIRELNRSTPSEFTQSNEPHKAYTSTRESTEGPESDHFDDDMINGYPDEKPKGKRKAAK
jgi:hypothetical protein